MKAKLQLGRRLGMPSAVSIALTFTVLVGLLTLAVNMVLVRLEPRGTSFLKYDLTADVMLACVAGLVLYDLLRREAMAKRRAAELQQREDEAQHVRELAAADEAERRRLIQIMDMIPQGVCIIREDFNLDYVNPVMLRTFGPPDGRKCYEYLNGLEAPCEHCRHYEVIAGETVRREWVAPATQRIYEVIDTPMPTQGDVRLKLEVLHDVTEEVVARMRTEELIAEVALQAEEARTARALAEAHADELEALLGISRALTSTLESKPLLDLILGELKAVIDYSNAFLAMRQGEWLVVVAYRGPESESSLLGSMIPVDEAAGFQAVLKEGRPVVIPDLSVQTPLVENMRAAGEPLIWDTLRGCRAWLGVPLFVHDRVVGFLRLAHREVGHYNQRHAELALAIAGHAAMALENARLYEEARKVATLEERQRMAGELHDSVSQALYGIALGAHAAREQLEQAPEKLSDTLDYVLSLSETAVTEMRSLVFELHPESLEQLGLVLLLNKLTEAMAARDNLLVELDVCSEPSLSLDAKELLYRIAQEALRNISKHAAAQNVKLSLRTEGDCIELSVVDDGVGFDTSAQFPGHYGLHSMAERAGRLGGTLNIQSAPGRGTTVTAHAPLSSVG